MTPIMSQTTHTNDLNTKIYVYYPNYSLPDLSFLEQIFSKDSNSGPKTVRLSPTKHQMPEKESVSVQMREKTKSKARPKSYTDYETLWNQNLTQLKAIEDWDSLNILLPNEFKQLIQKQNTPNVEKQMSYDSYNPSVRMRSQRSSAQFSDNSVYSARRSNFGRNKRYSLQEYPNCQNTPNDSHNLIHNQQNNCIPRSQTFSNCHNSCHSCHHHCCHSCCHSSCCRTPRQSPPSSTSQSFDCDSNTTSIDKLCQLLAMDLSFNKQMNNINRQSVGTEKRSNFETLLETKEEKLSDYDNNLNNNYIFEDSLETLSTNPIDELSNKDKDGSYFRELKQMWESLAASHSYWWDRLIPTQPTPEPKPMPNQISDSNYDKIDDKNNSNAFEKNKRKGEEVRQKSVVKPEIPRKPKVVVRRPHSSIPRPTSLNTENRNCVAIRKSLIPVPKTGLKSPVNYTPKLKSNN